MEDSYLEELAYYDGETPGMVSVKRAFDSDLNENNGFYERTEDAYKQRRNLWPGKSKNLKKNNPGAKPWQYASDNEAWVIDPIIDGMVALCWNAWKNGMVTAAPVGSEDLERATSMTNFMRWSMNSWVQNPEREFGLAANYMFEKSFTATYVGWERKRTPLLERISLEEMAEENPELAELFADEENDEQIIEALQNSYELVNEKRAMKALKQLRKEGVADIPVTQLGIDRPLVSTKAPDSEVILPPYTIDPEKSNRAHVISFLSAQDLEAMGQKEGWDMDIVADIIQNHMGVTQRDIDGQMSTDGFLSRGVSTTFHTETPDSMELTPIVRTFMKKVDKEDGAVGIYEVIWSPRMSQMEDDEQYLSYDLMNGFDSFPIVFTTFKDDAKRVFEGRSVCDNLRGIQRNAKVLADLTIDNASIAMDPPRFHPVGNPPSRWGAGVTQGIRRGTRDEYGTHDVPNMMRDGVEHERFLLESARDIVGLNMDDPISIRRQQYFVDRMLLHWSKVCKMVWKVYKEYGPEEQVFRITNDPTIAPQTFTKGASNEELDISISYDVRLADNEYVKDTVETSIKLMQVDVAGAADQREVMNVNYQLAMPQFASRILRSAEESEQDIKQKVAEDLGIISSGQTVQAQPTGANVAIPYIEQYAAQPDVSMLLQANPEFARRLNEYYGAYVQQVVQQQNAFEGKFGQPRPDVLNVQ